MKKCTVTVGADNRLISIAKLINEINVITRCEYMKIPALNKKSTTTQINISTKGSAVHL